MHPKPLILITNDDGIHSPGLTALFTTLQNLGECVVVAPDRDNSAVSHSLTMHRPLRVTQIAEYHYTIDGTPTDCVALALNKIVARQPALLVSGINHGLNLGDDISYSGTVSAAVEGTMYSIPSLAISQACSPHLDSRAACEVAQRLATMTIDHGLPTDTLLNVNIPEQGLTKGIKVTRQGRRLWDNAIQESRDPWGRQCYWIGGGTPRIDSEPDTDSHAVQAGYISVTPIHLDLTNHTGLDYLKEEWKLEQEED